jgi:hypothetical protein
MRWFWLFLGLLSLAMYPACAQRATVSGDALGAHLIAGRGCNSCHAGHVGTNSDSQNAAESSGDTVNALWGRDPTSLYGKTIATGGGQYTETLPASMSAGTPDVDGVLICLSCHDGNYASSGMVKNRVYESLPATYGKHNTIPTMFGTRESNYLSQHPIGMSAQVHCGGPENWDCSESNGEISMNGPMSSRFVQHYGFFVAPGLYNKTSVVVCTTCHDPHSMRAVNITSNSKSGLPPGTYATTFFLRAPYNPNTGNPNSNTAAQFCRQCHADKSNEMNGSTAGTIL